ncbi:Verlamelin biosynthesis protein B like [Verticillium longisporum]|nr:Verlamelin biosynthesis protein B like [Verticillium longisporum]
MDYFKSFPWFDALTKEPGFVSFTPVSRSNGTYGDNEPPRNQILRQTFNNSDTIPHCTGFYLKEGTSPHADGHGTKPSAIDKSPTKRPSILSCSVVYDLRAGLSGFNHGHLQGGLVAVLMDDAMTSLTVLNGKTQTRSHGERELPAEILDLRNRRAATAYINVQFRKPIVTPQVVIVTASFVSTERRKLILRASIKDEKGDICATGDSLIIGDRDPRDEKL